MKDALEKQNLRPFLMIQALGFHVPDAENLKDGYHELPEYPYCENLSDFLYFILNDSQNIWKIEQHNDVNFNKSVSVVSIHTSILRKYWLQN